MEDVEEDFIMLRRLKSLLVTVRVDGAMEEAVSGVGAEAEAEAEAEGEKPKIPSKGLRRLVSLRVRDGTSCSAGWTGIADVD
jgi:hypothetical protein